MQNMMPVPPPPFRLKTSPTVMMAAPISQANVQQTTFPTFVNPPVSQPPAVSMPPTVSMHPSTPFTVAVATGGSEALAATTASRRETANIYEMMLQETRPKRQAETEPLLGAPIQTNNTINFYNAENYTMGTNTVNMSSVGTVGMGNSNSNNTSNNTTGVQRNIAADPPPFAFSANSRAVQEMPKIVEYKMSTGFVQESSIPPFEKNMGFMTPPERPGAPSPSGNQDSMSAPTSTSISTIIKQAEAFLQTNSEPTERKSIEPLINLIEFEEAQKHIEELCKTHGLCRDYNKDGSLVFGPAGKRIKDNIVQLWIEKMVNQPQETLGTGGGVIFEMETPLYFNVANTKNVQCPISICQNTECGFVADTVAFIHERSNNEIQYDGSSLDQLLKKQEMVNPKCPKCDSGTLGEPLMGYKEVPIFIGGTCMDATKEDGSRYACTFPSMAVATGPKRESAP